MSDKVAVQAHQRKSTNKNIQKLRTISMVCNLTSSWQQWATENEKKQTSEPSGWAPFSQGGATEPPRRTWVPEKNHPIHAQLTDASKNHLNASGDAQNSSPAHLETQDGSETEVDTSAESPVGSSIKVKQVAKTVTSGVQEKSAGIVFLTEKIKKECLLYASEIDQILGKKSRRCSNTVSSLTKGWKQVEKQLKPGEEGGGAGNQVVDTDGCPVTVMEKLDAQEKESNGDVSEEESAVKIKRPTGTKKEAEDANKINALSEKYSAVGNLKSRWQNWASEHTVNQKLNPFSEYFDHQYSMSLRLQKGQEGYGHPKEGTKTAERAKRAEQHIHREIDDLCYVIRIMVDPDPDGKSRVTFGQLFDRYVRISDKVVGILMRARKHGKVAFEGEMLWQGQDDGVVITLLV